MKNIRDIGESSIFPNAKVIVTIDELMYELELSRTTVFRHLKKEGFLTSINFKGQYHIKNTSLKFNKHGLVNKDGKIFSKYGNLTQTILNLINDSISGMTVTDLNNLTGTKTHMQCCNLQRKGLLFRKKYNGTYCYFSSDKAKRESQQERKRPQKKAFDLNEVIKSETSESMNKTIKVLVTCVNNPNFTPKSIAISLIRRGNNIRTETVIEILKKYNIIKKKS